MSSCLSGGGNTAAYGISLDIIKSPSSTSSGRTTTTMTTMTSHSSSSSSSSPSSTLSESSNSQLAISTRKARTPRKRPNQTYSEAAALLSTAYPNIFSAATDLNKPCKFIKPHDYSSFEDSSDDQLLLMPFASHNDNRPSAFQIDSTTTTTTTAACSYLRHEYVSHQISHVCEDGYGDFDTESILDEETEEGAIDSIMGNNKEETTDDSSRNGNGNGDGDFCYGYPLGLGLGFDIGFGMIRGGLASSNPFRQNDQGDWWKFPAVNVGEISPTLNQAPEKKKKKKKLMRLINALTTSPAPEAKGAVSSVTKQQEDSETSLTSTKNNSITVPKSKSKGGNGMLLLKLNYDAVLDAWSDKSSVFSEDLTSSDFTGTDAALQARRLSQINLFGESGALREASVQRYKEKRRTRLFSKKIRYQVRKVNADQRPRMKGRFVRRLNSSDCEEET